MRVLGIDPGLGRLGWGIVEVQNSEFRVQSFGCLETPANTPVEKRLLTIHQFISKLLKTEKPDVLSIEELFFGANAKTAFAVGQARGVVLVAAAAQDADVAVYTPMQVKMAVTGYGRAEKKQVGQMVKVLLKLDSIPRPDDTADALAIALTHALSYKMKRL
ncbi:MAG TPA: crossover junction endodeoxyribonuclease RuvC [Candidatus Saccharimonadales bacterium]|nr:crossover junction endodeoxyribonuclease RuvC [Candidatus Saccharimonadales bacterium]